MKRLLLSLAVLLTIALGVSAATALRVTPLSGDPVTFLLDNNPEISFAAQSLTITSTAQPVGVRFEMDNIEAIDFIDETGVKDLATDQGITVSYAPGRVNFANVPAQTKAAVYGADGRCVQQAVVSGEYTVADLPAGIYVIKVGSFVTKVRL